MQGLNIFKYFSRKFSGPAKMDDGRYNSDLPEIQPTGPGMLNISSAQRMLAANTKIPVHIQSLSQQTNQNVNKNTHLKDSLGRDYRQHNQLQQLFVQTIKLSSPDKRPITRDTDHKPTSIMKHSASIESNQHLALDTDKRPGALKSCLTSSSQCLRIPRTARTSSDSQSKRTGFQGDRLLQEPRIIGARHQRDVNYIPDSYCEEEKMTRTYSPRHPQYHASKQYRPSREIVHRHSCPMRVYQSTQLSTPRASNMLVKSSSAPEKTNIHNDKILTVQQRGIRGLSNNSYTGTDDQLILGTLFKRESSVGSLDLMASQCDNELRVGFEEYADIHQTYHSDVYDRSPSAKTTGSGEEMMAVYYDLMKFKITEMVVHEKSLMNTNKHLFHLRPNERADMLNVTDRILTEYENQRQDSTW
ncbi:hypothetical protein SARC_08490 [Sphaeroforma arctica JP610]|uniref:Uncharacterized protein n=1 Tax=Sphaeroforma arctica JP610 TaxID=667725 RepID=A0A0L0FQS0_9EUKA|nr:hypothetical protein SARC_08490 [Sphaeroforma arctica JP610]KNC79105.1 hypothetical protein SARC_08490 [Sphaeroforma arctica JP610]|eukprot:XP_014153007.1 hypothetical protein SARC_08490 [Sphaeroforma arctica JP610]